MMPTLTIKADSTAKLIQLVAPALAAGWLELVEEGVVKAPASASKPAGTKPQKWGPDVMVEVCAPVKGRTMPRKGTKLEKFYTVLKSRNGDKMTYGMIRHLGGGAAEYPKQAKNRRWIKRVD